MIRYIQMDEQVNSGERRFAFWDTVTDRFVTVGGDQSWCSIADLREAFDIQDRFDVARGVSSKQLRARLVELARCSGAAEEDPSNE